MFAGFILGCLTPLWIAAGGIGGPVHADRVRFEYACPQPSPDLARHCRDSGVLEAIDASTIRLWTRDAESALVIPADAVRRAWVADGTRGNFALGAAIGLVAGAVLGGIIGSTQEFCFIGCDPATEIGAAIGVPAGLLMGGIVGSTIRTDRWREVQLSELQQRGGPGTSHGLGLTLSTSW